MATCLPQEQIVTNKSMSEKSNVTSGVPQGTVLGPVLFLIMISDIDTDITTSVVSSFADDTRVSKKIGSTDDTEVLQQDLNKIYAWSERNNMQFNDDKFELMRYGTDTEIKNQTCYKGPDKSLIKEKQSVKDLGVYMNTDLTFGTHIDKICSNANKYCSWIFRTFSARDKTTLLTLWKAIVQPRLDYCSQLWSPHKINEIEKLESIARSYTCKISEATHPDYWE